MFKVYLTNFGYYTADEYLTMEDAFEAGRKTGFKFIVDEVGNPELENAEADLAMFEMGL